MNVSAFLHPVVQIYEIRMLIISKQSLINQMKLGKTVIQCKNIGSIIDPNKKKGALNLRFRNSQRKKNQIIHKFSGNPFRKVPTPSCLKQEVGELCTICSFPAILVIYIKRKPSSGCINPYHHSAVISTGSLEHMVNRQSLTRLGDGALVIQALGHVKPRKTTLRKIKGNCTSPK